MNMSVLLFAMVLVVVIVYTGVGVGGQHYVDEGNLQTALLTSYLTDVRPQATVNVTVTLMPLSLTSLDIQKQTMTLSAIYVMMWTDDRLAWTPATYGNIEDFVIASEKVWSPSLVVVNEVSSMGRIGGSGQDNTPLRVDYTGLVKWYPPLVTSTSCEVSIYLYPFDVQECHVTLSGWGFSRNDVDLSFTPINWTYYEANGEWELLGDDTMTGTFSDGTDHFKRLDFNFTFRRRWPFYMQNVILPMVLTSMLICGIFVVPLESGEKLGYALTVMLSYTVFLSWVTDRLPAVSNQTSVLQIYLSIVLVLGVMATLLTIWVAHLHHRPPSYPRSPGMRLFLRLVLVPLWDFRCQLCQQRRTNVIEVKESPIKSSSSSKEDRRVTFASELTVKKNGGGGGDSDDGDDQLPKTSFSIEKVKEAEVTWQEVAAMTDFLFLVFYMMAKPVLTMVMLFVLMMNHY